MIVPFPEGCPPPDATPLEGVFYVCAERNLTPGEQTGRMTWQRPYEKRLGDYAGRVDLVEAHALSVFGDIEDIHNARGFTPWMRKKSVAEVSIASSEGWLKNTPTQEGQSHHDWWTDPHDLIPSAMVIEGAVE